MESGVDVLIEKPLAISLTEADELVKIAAEKGRIDQVGHLERFNPAVRATLPLITQPMFFEVHRMSVFTPRSLDVDVVLDLGDFPIDLDIVLSFVKSPVSEAEPSVVRYCQPAASVCCMTVERRPTRSVTTCQEMLPSGK